MYFSDLGLSAGGFDYTASAKSIFKSLPKVSSLKYTVIALSPNAAVKDRKVLAHMDAIALFESIGAKVMNGDMAYVGLFASNGTVLDEKVDPDPGNHPIDPYSQPGSGPSKAGSGPSKAGPDVKPTFVAARKASMLPWLVLAVGAVGLVVYSRKP